MDGRVSFTPEQVTGSGGGPKTRVPIRHAVKPSFGGFDSRWGLRPPSFRATPHTLGGWRHSAVSESGTGLGVTQASRSITRRARKANGLCQGTWRASGRAHASPRGGEGAAARWGQGVRLPSCRFSRVGPHHPRRQTLLAKLSLLPWLTSMFQSRCGQHVCSCFYTAASRQVEPRRAKRGVNLPRPMGTGKGGFELRQATTAPTGCS